MRQPTSGFATLVETLRWRADHQSGRLAYRFLPDGEVNEFTITYGELDLRVRAIAARLQSLQRRGDRTLLVYPPGLDFVAAYLACLYAGTVSVVLAPPPRGRVSQLPPRLQGIWRDANPSVVLTTQSIRADLRPHTDSLEGLGPDHCVVTDPLPAASAGSWQVPVLRGADLAFLQYTSGSTTEPRGVMVSHGNLAHNLRAIEVSFGLPPDSEIVCWLPPYHDMGLIGGILAPLHLGMTATLMPPVAFVQRPARWLQALSRYRATASGGPNFAYDHCVRRITSEQRTGLDLSGWEVAFCGAEPISAQTLRNFTEAFAPCGFSTRSFKPCYGLAEATLLVAAGPSRTPPIIRHFRRAALAQHEVVPCSGGSTGAGAVPSCGWPSERVVIVDPEALTECPPGRVGEIWVTGPSVALGYWNRPEETAAAFGGRLEGRREPFLRTGDLGFLLESELFVTGRLKDLIIVDGANHYPQDIERTVGDAHSALVASECAAFSVDVAGREELVVVASPRHRAAVPAGDLEQAIRTAVSAHHDLRLHEIVLVKTGRLPKTTSGKVQRRTCRRDYLAGTLDRQRQA